MGRYALTPQTVTWPQVAPRFFCFGPVFLSPAALLARLCAAMGKKGKRASSDGSSVGADTSRRRSAGPTAEETLRKTRVAGPAVLPPPTADRKSNKRVELDLVSKRIYQETILRCVRSSIVVEAKQRKDGFEPRNTSPFLPARRSRVRICSQHPYTLLTSSRSLPPSASSSCVCARSSRFTRFSQTTVCKTSTPLQRVRVMLVDERLPTPQSSPIPSPAKLRPETRLPLCGDLSAETLLAIVFSARNHCCPAEDRVG